MTEERNYNYISIGDVQEHTLKFTEEVDGVDFDQVVYYIPALEPNGLQYLHRDGEIREGTSGGSAWARLAEGAEHLLKTEQDIWDMYTGYFSTSAEAECTRVTYEKFSGAV